MVPVEEITEERLARWKVKMKDAHATPLMLIGVGHDHKRGEFVICTLDEPELSKEFLRGLLVKAVELL